MTALGTVDNFTSSCGDLVEFNCNMSEVTCLTQHYNRVKRLTLRIIADTDTLLFYQLLSTSREHHTRNPRVRLVKTTALLLTQPQSVLLIIAEIENLKDLTFNFSK